MKLYRALASAICSLLIFSHAYADVVYENGSLNGIDESAQISPSQSLSNSFSVADASRLTMATVGLWSPLGSAPATLTWLIGTTPFEDDIGSATVALTNVLQGSSGGFLVYLSSFSLDLTLNSGDYWLTLSNGSSTNAPFLGWDINDGPSRAFYQNEFDMGEARSEYFRLEGVRIDDPTPVPEPASVAITLLGLAWLICKRRHARS